MNDIKKGAYTYMKKTLAFVSIFILSLFSLTGCGKTEGKSSSITVIYGVIALLSAIILIGFLVREKKETNWFSLLFFLVFVVNLSYFWLSVSNTLGMALMANRIAYLGSTFLPMTMLFIILDATNTTYPKWLSPALSAFGAIVFLFTASQGIFSFYYKSVELDTSLGYSFLVKEYGPLHLLYSVYLIGYFAVMVGFIILAITKKKTDSPSHAVVLVCSVLANIGVWTLGKTWDIEFEFLSVSYLISELFLIGLHTLISENEKLKALIKEKESVPMPIAVTAPALEGTPASEVDSEKLDAFLKGIEELTNTEKLIFDAYIAHSSTKEIMASLNIKENTLKFHNKNIYGKLGVSSRKQLQEIHSIIASQNNDKTE